MVRILFFSAVAFVAYKYIARSNQKHQRTIPGNGPEVLGKVGATEVLAPAPQSPPKTQTERWSPAAEPDPRR